MRDIAGCVFDPGRASLTYVCPLIGGRSDKVG